MEEHYLASNPYHNSTHAADVLAVSILNFSSLRVMKWNCTCERGNSPCFLVYKCKISSFYYFLIKGVQAKKICLIVRGHIKKFQNLPKCKFTLFLLVNTVTPPTILENTCRLETRNCKSLVRKSLFRKFFSESAPVSIFVLTSFSKFLFLHKWFW